jgi:hypothetical protein
MKKVIFTLLCFLSIAGVSQAQSTTIIQDLDQVILAARDARTAARSTRDNLRSLALDYFQFNNPNPNVIGYLAVMNANMTIVENAMDVIVVKSNSALLKNSAIDISDLLAWAAQIDLRAGYVRTQSQLLATAISQNNRQAAQQANIATRNYLGEQILIAADIINSAGAQKLIAQVYNVRITLVTSNGQPVVGSNGLQGYYAIDQATQLAFWPTSQDGLVFEGLPAGTYEFSAYNGYFDGAGSNLVTLNPSMINANGEVIVQLVYWSE